MTNAWGSNNKTAHDACDAFAKRSETHIQANAEPAKRASSGAEDKSSTGDSRKATSPEEAAWLQNDLRMAGRTKL